MDIRRMPFADTLFIHGDIYSCCPSYGRLQALAVHKERIVAVGSDAEMLTLKGPSTSVIDLCGQFVMPGFNDAHLHLAMGGFEKLNVDLIGAKSLSVMQERILNRAKTTKPGEWITGRGWDHTLWADQALPSRAHLDEVTGDLPAMFTRVDGHIAVANSAALRLAGITPTSQVWATGIVRESEMKCVAEKIPRPSIERRRQAIELALADAAQWGVTSVQDNSEWDDFLVYEQLANEGYLTTRVSEWLPFETPIDVLEARRRHHHSQTDSLLNTSMLKGFIDGSLGSRTAALFEPYHDDQNNVGIVEYRKHKLNEMTKDRARAGFQIGFHAIGDLGADMALQAFAAAMSTKAPNDWRPRIEHAQVLTPKLIDRICELKVIASVQPNHLLTDMSWAMARLGKQRAELSYVWSELVNRGVVLAFGTDYPVEPITPFRGLYAAVTRQDEAGKAAYFPAQRLTITEAIAAYTTGSANAEFMEKDKGTLAPGMLADFVVLDRDITKVAPLELLKTIVLRTVVGGKTVFSRACSSRAP